MYQIGVCTYCSHFYFHIEMLKLEAKSELPLMDFHQNQDVERNNRRLIAYITGTLSQISTLLIQSRGHFLHWFLR